MASERASRHAFFGVSGLLFACSAALTIVWCASMSAMGGMPMPGGWTMSMAWMRMPGQTWPGAAASFLGMWVVMMVAMMLPSLIPMLWRYRRAVRGTGETRLGGLTVLVSVAYFFVWAVFGTAAFPLGRFDGGGRPRACAGRDAAAALAAFDRAAAQLGVALLYREANPDGGSDLAGRIAAGSARAYLRLGEPYLAGIEVRRALNISAEKPDLHVLLGTSLYRQGRFEEAEASFAAALRLDPASSGAHAGQGLLELTANHLASARESFERAYRLDADPERLRVLARIAFIERDYGAAATRLKEYLERAPDLAPARRDEARSGHASTGG